MEIKKGAWGVWQGLHQLGSRPCKAHPCILDQVCDAPGAHRRSFRVFVGQITEIRIILSGDKDIAPIFKGGDVLLYTHLVMRTLGLLCTIMGYDCMVESDV